MNFFMPFEIAYQILVHWIRKHAINARYKSLAPGSIPEIKEEQNGSVSQVTVWTVSQRVKRCRAA